MNAALEELNMAYAAAAERCKTEQKVASDYDAKAASARDRIERLTQRMQEIADAVARLGGPHPSTYTDAERLVTRAA